MNVPVSQPPGTRFRGVCHMVLRAPQQDERPRPQSNPLRTDTLCFPSPSPFLTCASWDHLQINHLHPPVCVSGSAWENPTQDLWCVWTIILARGLHRCTGRVALRLWLFRQSRGATQARRPPCGLSALRWAQLLHFVPSGGWVSRTHTALPCLAPNLNRFSFETLPPPPLCAPTLVPSLDPDSISRRKLRGGALSTVIPTSVLQTIHPTHSIREPFLRQLPGQGLMGSELPEVRGILPQDPLGAQPSLMEQGERSPLQTLAPGSMH